MSKEKRSRKIKHDKFFTRAKSEKMLAAGADPTATFINDKGNKLGRYTDHPNFHVRNKAWKKMGSLFPTDVEECAKLCKSLRIKDPNAVKEEAVQV